MYLRICNFVFNVIRFLLYLNNKVYNEYIILA